MPRDITVTFDDGSSHMYQGAPDDITPEQITERASKDFSGRSVTHLDGGKKKEAAKPAKDPADDKHSSEEYSPKEYVDSLRKDRAKFGQKLSKEDEKRALEATPEARRMAKFGDEAKKEGLGGLAKGAAEAGLTALTGLASTTAGGVLGGLRTAYNLASGEGMDKSVNRGVETIGKVQKAATYQPRTSAGKLLTDVVGATGEVPGKITGALGGGIGQALGGDVGELRGEAIGEVAPSLLAGAAGLRGAVGSARQAALRERAPVPGKDVSPLRDLSPEQQARIQSMTEQGIKPTLGQVTRDPAQFRFEEEQAAKKGSPLRTRELDTNEALIKAVEDTDKLRAGRKTTENKRQTGQYIASALEEKADESMKNVSQKYKEARDSGETKQLVPTKPLEDYFQKTRFRRKTVTALDAISNQMEAMKKERGARGRLTIDDLEDLYKSANELSSPTDPVTARHMTDIKKAINTMTEGAGGDLYRDARKARLTHALEFEDRDAIARLIDKKSRTDYKTASEDVFDKTVIKGSLEELKDVTTSLLDTDPKKNPKGWQAVREMQGQMIDHLMDKSGVGGDIAKSAKNERGAPVFSPQAFRNAVREVGKDKIEYLLGKDALDRLYTTVQNAENVKEAPGKTARGDSAKALSDEMKSAAMDAAKSTILSRVPGLKYVAPILEERAKARAAAVRTEESLNPRKASPEEIYRQAKEVKKQESKYRMEEGLRAAQAGSPSLASPLLQPKEEDRQ